MRRTIVPAGAPGQTLQFSYTYEQNVEDNVRAGFGSARRDVLFQVFADANTGVSSLIPAVLTVSNPPPDMSEILPAVTPLFEAALINFNQWVEPRDFSHYTVFLDVVNPPLAVYQDLGVAFRQLAPVGLPAGVTQYVYILPHDTFGAGIPSQIASFTPVSLTADFLDTVPPDMPTGLTLTTGSDLSDDGTVATWVRASWVLAPEPDVAGYEVHVFVGSSLVPTVYNPIRSQNSIQFPVPGNLTVRVKLLTFDKFHNISAFTAEATITTGRDTTRPAAPTNLVGFGNAKSINLLWTPPPDPDYAYAEVWSHTSNNRALAQKVGQGAFSFLHDGLSTLAPRFYWIISVDTSGNFSTDWYPAGATSGIGVTPGQLDTTWISDLAANKITAGILNVLVELGVGGNLLLNGPQAHISVFDNQTPTKVARVVLGRLGPLSTQYGLQLFGPAGQLMWNFATGATEDGITDAAVTTKHIRAGSIEAAQIRADVAVITTAAQIATAIINTGHIQNLAVNGQAHIQDLSVVAANIADANITRAKIQDLAVNSAKIEELTATKISAGSLQATYSIGVGSFISLDGPNHLITIRDAALTSRVFLGRVGANYGLQVFGPAGQLMWDFTDGARTAGIAPAAVTTPKITPNAVTASILYGVGGEVITSTAEIVAATITWPLLEAGDALLLLATAIGNVAANQLTVRLRHDGVSGTVITVVHLNLGAAGGKAPVAIHALYGVPAIISNKTFVVTIQETTSTGTVSVQDMSFSIIRFQR